MMSEDELTVIEGLIEYATDFYFSNLICEDLPDDLQRIADKHPEWALEFHTWNGDPEEVEDGETINLLSILGWWSLLKIRSLRNTGDEEPK